MTSFGITSLELEEKLAPIEDEVTQSIEDSKKTLLNKAYPVGSVYTTTEDLSAADMHEQFGGRWEQIKDTFLWAQDSEDEEYETVPKTSILGQYSGLRYYNFTALLGPDEDDEIAFSLEASSEYMNNTTPSTSIKSGEYDDGSYMTEGNLNGSIPVTEETSANRTTEIMPPYVVVKMFKRVS